MRFAPDRRKLNLQGRLFRGQPVRGNLLPSIARPNPKVDTTTKERQVLGQLSLLGASLLPAQTQNQLELLVLAQHYGLQTRLLDWTANPLAALWFACSTKAPGTGFVYEIAADDLLSASTYNQDPFEAVETRAFQPRLSNARILARHGWFTLHRWSPPGKKFVPLEINPRTRSRLVEYAIPEAVKAELMVSLDLLGISYRTLFPDLSGLCSYLNWCGTA